MLLSNILTLGTQVRCQDRPLPVDPEVERNRDSRVVAPSQVAPPALVTVSDVSLPRPPPKTSPMERPNSCL